MFLSFPHSQKFAYSHTIYFWLLLSKKGCSRWSRQITCNKLSKITVAHVKSGIDGLVWLQGVVVKSYFCAWKCSGQTVFNGTAIVYLTSKVFEIQFATLFLKLHDLEFVWITSNSIVIDHGFKVEVKHTCVPFPPCQVLFSVDIRLRRERQRNASNRFNTVSRGSTHLL